MKKAHIGYALLGVGAARLYHEQVPGGFGATLSPIMNVADFGGSLVTYVLLGVGAWYVYKSR